MNVNKFLKGRLQGDLSIIRDKANYHENFLKVINRCATAELEMYVLLNEGIITREEYDSYYERIQKYKERAVKAHGEFLINSLEQTKMQFSPRTLISSVYYDLFGIELPGAVKLKERIRKEFETPDIPFAEWFNGQLQKNKAEAIRKLLIYLIYDGGCDCCSRCVHLNTDSCCIYNPETGCADKKEALNDDYCIEGMLKYFELHSNEEGEKK